MKVQPAIIFEDDDLIIVNKPANYLTIPARFKKESPNVYNWLQRDRTEVFIVHRLDRETSGILCFAKTESSHKILSKQFQEREVEKHHLPQRLSCFTTAAKSFGKGASNINFSFVTG